MRPNPFTTPPAPIRRVSGARIFRRVVLAVCVLTLTACAGRTRNPFDQSPEAQGVLLIWLENRGFNDVRVYAVTAAGQRSLGPVGGNTFQRASLSWRQLDQISFRIEVLAGRTYTTTPWRPRPATGWR